MEKGKRVLKERAFINITSILNSEFTTVTDWCGAIIMLIKLTILDKLAAGDRSFRRQDLESEEGCWEEY
jgi:hypothetical protein